ncbi:MAG TPA: GGDEF domain-containing protein [Candidatus Paceibacterota bacterium]|nr:GGDEF domain-containing protein [Candidatus Paceibacterota bacterium]
MQRLEERERELEQMKRRLKARERHIKRLQTELRTDHLTKLPNRQSFYEELVLEADRARRKKTSLYVVYFDIDHFKRINDTYGHAVGDKVLVKIGRILRRELRSDEFSARIAGDEFAIILSSLRRDEDAERMLDRLRKKMERCLCVSVVDRTIFATASFGVAKMRPSEKTDAFLVRVDDAMYTAKKRGRNVVHVSS